MEDHTEEYEKCALNLTKKVYNLFIEHLKLTGMPVNPITMLGLLEVMKVNITHNMTRKMEE